MLRNFCRLLLISVTADHTTNENTLTQQVDELPRGLEHPEFAFSRAQIVYRALDVPSGMHLVASD